MQTQVSISQGVASASDQVKLALINLLVLEEAFVKDPSNHAVLKGSCGEYFGDVVTVVAGFRDPRSIDALVGVMVTGGIVGNAVASFGVAALDKVIAASNTTDIIPKFSALFVLGDMLDAGTVTDAVSIAKIRAVFNSSSVNADDSVARTALEGLLKLFHVSAPLLLKRVQIAIKPGESPASINPGSNGVIPVAVLSSSTFDARTIDDTTARFGPGQASQSNRAHVEDVNGDGLPDLVFQFPTPESMIACSDTASFLYAKTTSGQTVVGAAAIRTVGCN